MRFFDFGCVVLWLVDDELVLDVDEVVGWFVLCGFDEGDVVFVM